MENPLHYAQNQGNSRAQLRKKPPFIVSIFMLLCISIFTDLYTVDCESNLNVWANMIRDCIEEGDPFILEGYHERMLGWVASITLEELEEARAQVFKPERMVTVVIEPKV